MLVLIVEDEADIARLLELGLGAAGFETATAQNGQAALRLAAERKPQVVLLDWMLPDLPGPEVCRQLKRRPETNGARVVFVTARGSEADRVQAFAAGADDYVTKPFFLRELILRCQALARTVGPRRAETSSGLRVGPLHLEPGSWRCYLDGVERELTPIQFKLLEHLMKAPDRVHTRKDLLRAVWERNSFETRTVDVHMARLREALRPFDGWLQTVRGVGYRLGPPRD